MLRKHGRPQVVMMSAEHYARLTGQPSVNIPEPPPTKVNAWSSMRHRAAVDGDGNEF